MLEYSTNCCGRTQERVLQPGTDWTDKLEKVLHRVYILAAAVGYECVWGWHGQRYKTLWRILGSRIYCVFGTCVQEELGCDHEQNLSSTSLMPHVKSSYFPDSLELLMALRRKAG